MIPTRRTARMRCAAALGAVTIIGLPAAAPIASAKTAPAHPGTLVSGFGSAGRVTLPTGTQLLATAVQPDGDVLAAGSSGTGTHARVLVVRVLPTGQLDPHFGHAGTALGPSAPVAQSTGSVARAIAVEPNSTIVIAGTVTSTNPLARKSLLVERFTAQGRPDPHFGHGGVVTALGAASGEGDAVIVQGQRIIAAGDAVAEGTGGGSFPRVAVVALGPSGQPDTTFGSHGVATIDLGPYSTATALGAASGGRIVLAGSTSPDLRTTEALVARLTPAGALDTTFASHGAYVAQLSSGEAFSALSAVTVAGNGSLTAAGAATATGSRCDALVLRLTGAGQPDSGFGHLGVVDATSATECVASGTTYPGATGVAVTPSGEVLAAGVHAQGVLNSPALWAFTSAGRPDTRFGHGGTLVMSSAVGVSAQALGLALGQSGQAVVAGVEDIGPATAGLLASVQT